MLLKKWRGHVDVVGWLVESTELIKNSHTCGQKQNNEVPKLEQLHTNYNNFCHIFHLTSQDTRKRQQKYTTTSSIKL
jgi:hypothetical protein